MSKLEAPKERILKWTEFIKLMDLDDLNTQQLQFIICELIEAVETLIKEI